MKYFLEFKGMKIEFDTEEDIKEAHKKIEKELIWLSKMKDRLEPYEP